MNLASQKIRAPSALQVTKWFVSVFAGLILIYKGLFAEVLLSCPARNFWGRTSRIGLHFYVSRCTSWRIYPWEWMVEHCRVLARLRQQPATLPSEQNCLPRSLMIDLPRLSILLLYSSDPKEALDRLSLQLIHLNVPMMIFGSLGLNSNTTSSTFEANTIIGVKRCMSL